MAESSLLASYGSQPYGGQPYGGRQDLGYGGAGYGYGVMGAPAEDNAGFVQKLARKPFATSRRRRLNIVPALICLFLPWGLFVFDFWISSFAIRYDNPWVYDVAVAGSVFVVLVFAAAAVWSRYKIYLRDTERDPSWILFLAVSMTLACAVGLFQGENNYRANARPYYDFHSLSSYTGVHVDGARGQQVMDAGAVAFAPGTGLDITRSEGWKEGTMYCVAPIVLGNATPATYDFWAVGTDCCSGYRPNFHCEGWYQKDYGGLRVMDGSKDKYRLAVQQAEAAYGIRAVHPLFFEWMRDPIKTVNGWQSKAWNTFVIWIFAWLAFQAFCVVVAALAFARLGAP